MPRVSDVDSIAPDDLIPNVSTPPVVNKKILKIKKTEPQ